MAEQRRRRSRDAKKANRCVWPIVREKLAEKLSPEQTAGCHKLGGISVIRAFTFTLSQLVLAEKNSIDTYIKKANYVNKEILTLQAEGLFLGVLASSTD